MIDSKKGSDMTRINDTQAAILRNILADGGQNWKLSDAPASYHVLVDSRLLERQSAFDGGYDFHVTAAGCRALNEHSDAEHGELAPIHGWHVVYPVNYDDCPREAILHGRTEREVRQWLAARPYCGELAELAEVTRIED